MRMLIAAMLLSLCSLSYSADVTITWTHPVERENGDPLPNSELGGFRIYSVPANYVEGQLMTGQTLLFEVNNTATEYDIDNTGSLTPTGTVNLAMTAFDNQVDEEGISVSQESKGSNMVTVPNALLLAPWFDARLIVSGPIEPPTLALVQLELDEGGGSIAINKGTLSNGMLMGNPVYEANTADRSAFALRLDGANDWIDLGNVDVAGSGLTLAAWFKADGYGSGDPRIISKATGVQSDEHIFMLSTINSNGVIRLRTRVRVNGTTTTLIASSGNLSVGVWYHATVTYEGSNLRLYLNGIEVDNTPLSGPVDKDPSVEVAVGSQPGGTTRFFDGMIDNVQILDRGLSPEEVLELASIPDVILPDRTVVYSYYLDTDGGLINPLPLSGVTLQKREPVYFAVIGDYATVKYYCCKVGSEPHMPMQSSLVYTVDLSTLPADGGLPRELYFDIVTHGGSVIQGNFVNWSVVQ
jgi:hypothetical protein